MLSHLQYNSSENSIKTNQAEEEEEEEGSWQKMHSFLSSPTPKSEISKSAHKSPPPSCLQRAPKMQLLNLLLLQSLVEKTSQQTERQKDWSLLEALLTHPMQQPKARRCTATNLLHTGRLTVD
jgi:hypothetical protein